MRSDTSFSATIARIASEGCTEMQGFLFSRLLPASEVERLFLLGHEAKPAPGRFVAA